MRRLETLQRHLTKNPTAQVVPPQEPPPQRVIREDGWGYADTGFLLDEKTRTAKLSGARYMFSGATFPNFVTWVETNVGINVDNPSPVVQRSPPPPPLRNEPFLEEIRGKFARISFDNNDRILHAHGHTCQEVYAVRFGHFERVPDLVIYPSCQTHVEAIVAAAARHNVCLIPFGGGTSVSGGLECPVDETRVIASVDMKEMNRIKWIDKENMTVCVEAGIVGQDLVRRLEAEGVCVGHEPDSLEFSTLGGWVATRASGMKKNVYGNIEDLLLGCTIVTPSGVLEKGGVMPRISCGPDLHHVALGSEGTLGIITQAVLKIRPVPQSRVYGSILFPSFADGVHAMREIALRRCQPASIRLVDNEQFQFAMALKPETSTWTQWIDAIKKFYVTKIKGFNPLSMCVATVLFEGEAAAVEQQQKLIYEIAAKHNGMNAGPENGHRGYFLTYVIAYLRDFALQYNFMSESFETSVPWDRVEDLCSSVKRRIVDSCVAHGVRKAPFSSCRVTQLYDSGVCVYFYLGFEYSGLSDPVGIFSHVYEDARDEILRQGGSVSHHHGIGKHRKKWVQQTISPAGIHILKSIKQSVDPQNIFGNRNIIDL